MKPLKITALADFTYPPEFTQYLTSDISVAANDPFNANHAQSHPLPASAVETTPSDTIALAKSRIAQLRATQAQAETIKGMALELRKKSHQLRKRMVIKNHL